MANASSIIRVSIVGDADKLTGALTQAEGKVGGLVKKIGAAFIALQVGREVIDFGDEAVEQADRLEDATTRIENQLGGLSKALKAGAGSESFLNLGLSPQDVLEMEARFADLATAIGLSDNAIASMAPNVTATAAAFAQLTDKSPDEVLDLIAKAAGGSAKAAKELGVSLDSTLNPSQQLTNILKQMAPSLEAVTTGTGDLELKQAQLQARVEKLQAELGGPLSDALTAVLDLILGQIAAIPAAMDGWGMLGDAIVDWGKVALTPIARVYDAFSALADLIRNTQNSIANFGSSGSSESVIKASQDAWENRNQGAR